MTFFGEEFNIANQLLIMATLMPSKTHINSADSFLNNIDTLEYSLFSSPIPCAIIDEDSTFKYVNESFASLVGYSRSELESRLYINLTHPEDVQGHRSMIERLMSGEQNHFTFQKRYITKFENIIKVYLYVQSIENSGDKSLFFVHVLPIEVYSTLSSEGNLSKSNYKNSKAFGKRVIIEQLEKHWLAILLAIISLIVFLANYIVDYNKLKWEVDNLKKEKAPVIKQLP